MFFIGDDPQRNVTSLVFAVCAYTAGAGVISVRLRNEKPFYADDWFSALGSAILCMRVWNIITVPGGL